MDRNGRITSASSGLKRSLSARRAWIEMAAMQIVIIVVDTSLSARRAWIEMSYFQYSKPAEQVALRKESVDRNCYLDNIEITQANVALRKESVDRN